MDTKTKAAIALLKKHGYKISKPKEKSIARELMNAAFAKAAAPIIKTKNLTIRKISLTCQLTDGSEYEGGELEFDFRQYDPVKRDELKHVVTEKNALSKGSIVLFPSFIWHRVKPVHRGTIYSIVVWFRGEKYK